MKVLHFGDIHFWRIGTDWDAFYLKRILGPANLAFRRRFKFPSTLAVRSAECIAASDADFVIFSGDATTMALPSEFRLAAAAFAPIRQKWGDRFFAIPGNHDRYSPRSVRHDYWQKALPWASPLEQGKKTCSRAISDQWTVVGFDASVPWHWRSNGLFDRDLQRDVEAEFQKHEGRKIILVGHYPFAYPAGVTKTGHHHLLGESLLAETVAKFKPSVYLHGHKHQRWALTPADSSSTLCLNCGSSGMKSSHPSLQAGWVEFTIQDDSQEIVEIHAVHLDGGGDPVRENLSICQEARTALAGATPR